MRRKRLKQVVAEALDGGDGDLSKRSRVERFQVGEHGYASLLGSRGVDYFSRPSIRRRLRGRWGPMQVVGIRGGTDLVGDFREMLFGCALGWEFDSFTGSGHTLRSEVESPPAVTGTAGTVGA